MKIAIAAGYAPSLRNFRGDLLRAMRRHGHEVLAIAPAPDPATREYLARIGVSLAAIPLHRAGMNPVGELAAYRAFVRIFRQARPDALLTYTIKPNLWGSLAARRAGVRHVFPMVTGLGYAFMENRNLRGRIAGGIARFLYRLAFGQASTVFFQNPDDERAFREMGLLPDRIPSVVLAGSGVNLAAFSDVPPGPLPPVRFLLVARLLADKGIREYAHAAERLRSTHPETECHLAGPADPNPTAIFPGEVDAWARRGDILYHGTHEDVRPLFRQCHVYVLPSYREGTPRTVLEAMSTGRAIITTDAPGCRETVRPLSRGERLEIGSRLNVDGCDGAGWLRIGALKVGANGILVPVRDAVALVQAMRFFLEHRELIPIMGRASRRYAEERYDVNKVNAEIMRVMGMGS